MPLSSRVMTLIASLRYGRRLRDLVDAEAAQLAQRVKDGELTRGDLERAAWQYGDAEPLIALDILDREGWK